MITIILCSNNRIRQERAVAHWRHVFGSEPVQIVTVFNPASLTSGYTEGMPSAEGEIVVFVHDDVEVLSVDFVQRLRRHMENFDVLGVAGTSRLVGAAWTNVGPPEVFGQVLHELGGRLSLYIYGAPTPTVSGIQAMDGLFLAFRREVIEKLQWDTQTFTGFHLYDLDVTYRAHLGGYRVGVANDLPVLHASGGSYDAALQVEAQKFMAKFSGRLATSLPRHNYRFMEVPVQSREEALPLMNPPHWSFPELKLDSSDRVKDR